ncbi:MULTISPECIES: SusC/RagA family TonB-linked outer membrane protein [Chryseobacterium]|uniref:SusC/RagA family TonB-linked outer membrane protein n=1 Tax=Chryseobacterium TaxID=59732 RepID=UPI00195E3A2A|nr:MULTISPECIES: SusC/RagA family TonB-linked outer membrane protein [Chryseobacterium]MBM7420331.1 TonB-linked SusC/RagA family outer membrane protein [Chryseobacterium sp. JUb44]MDH6210278.1 TonB-linked SusC/RagA family outer membrane protein [Chryseobacterium sp. BIGb0186]WSO08989.1 SusC/RagA family TonB-linked outer membrane protein [Chryseobacterium scophthalmum]
MKKAFILLPLLAAQIALAQEKKTITGKIDDGDTSKVIAGASIKIETQSVSTKTNQTGIIESVSIGTITDKNGNYTLEIPADTKSVTVSYLGYEPKMIQIYEGQTSYNITLIPVVSDDIPEKNNIQEVIITGYQKIEKRKQTSAVTTVKMNDIQQAGVASVDQLLAGQIAGVAVTPETGAPGSPAKIRIRGTASLSGPQDPLWVIDGLPLEGNDVPNFSDKDNIDQLQNFSIAGLNPNDIEDITILKDAAATAIYGARAANGVISITTKKGKKGSLRVNFSADTFITARPDFGKLNLLNASEKVDLELMLANRTDLTYRTDKGEVMRILTQNGQLDAYRNGGLGALNMLTRQQIDGLRNSNTDWGKLLYQNAINKQYGVSISGGSDRSDYYFSLGYYDEEGTTIGTGFERYNLTLKNNYKINDKLNFGVSVFGTQSERTSFVTDADASISPINYSRNANPYLSPYNADGSYRYDKDIDGFEDRYIPFNFLEERENTSYTLKNQSLKAIFDLDYKLAKGLKITSQLGLQYDGNKTEKFAAENTYFTRKMKEGTRYYKDGAYRYFLPDGGVKQNWDNSFFQYNWKLQGSYSTKINSVHEIDLMAGTELRKTEDNTTVTRAFGYDSVTRRSMAIVFPSSNFAAERKYETYREMPPIENAYASMFATASYTYDQKYTFFGSVRYDGTNLFGVNKKYKYLPIWAVSGSWLVSKEDFMKNLSVISNLRLRASYGLQGNIDRNTSPFFIGEYSDSTILPGGKENIINVISPPNDKLRWEKTTNVNFGLDLGVFNNRINLTADVYNRKGTDMISMKETPLETGFEYTMMNWGSLTNKGFELAVSTKNINKDNFKWSTTINFAHNKSNVLSEQPRDNALLPSREGLPVNAVFALKTAGMDENGNPMFWKGNEKVKIEDFFALYDVYADFLPGELVDSKLSNAELRSLFTYVGDRDPKFTGGIINTFKVSNFDLTVSATFNLKQTVMQTPSYRGMDLDRGRNYTKDIYNAGGSLPGITSSDMGSNHGWMGNKWLSDNRSNAYSLLDIWAKEISYLRISSIRLGYTLPKEFTNPMGISALRLSVEGRNLFVFSNGYKGYFDPETYGNIYAQPITKSVTVGFNVSF